MKAWASAGFVKVAKAAVVGTAPPFWAYFGGVTILEKRGDYRRHIRIMF